MNAYGSEGPPRRARGRGRAAAKSAAGVPGAADDEQALADALDPEWQPIADAPPCERYLLFGPPRHYRDDMLNDSHAWAPEVPRAIQRAIANVMSCVVLPRLVDFEQWVQHATDFFNRLCAHRRRRGATVDSAFVQMRQRVCVLERAIDEVRTRMGHLDDCQFAHVQAFSELRGSFSELRGACRAAGQSALSEVRAKMGHLDDCLLANQRAFTELRGSLSELRGACVAVGHSALGEARTKMGHLDDCLLANQRAFSELRGSLSELRDAREATAQSALNDVRTQISRLEGFQADNQRALSELRVGVQGLELLTSEHGLRGSDNAASALRELSLARSPRPRGRSPGPDGATVAITALPHDTVVAMAQAEAARARGVWEPNATEAACTHVVLSEFLGRRAAGEARCGSLPPHLLTRRG